VLEPENILQIVVYQPCHWLLTDHPANDYLVLGGHLAVIQQVGELQNRYGNDTAVSSGPGSHSRSGAALSVGSLPVRWGSGRLREPGLGAFLIRDDVVALVHRSSAAWM
jgi:hypothetical protein